MGSLIVGPGCIGRVLAFHLQRAGVRVGFFLKPAHRAACEQGFALLQCARRTRSVGTLRVEQLFTAAEDVQPAAWHTIYLCVPSPALRSAPLRALLQRCPDATVVLLQPGLDDRAAVRELVEADRLVAGMLSLLAWEAPLAAEQLPCPGTVFWFPPLSPSPFCGPRARAVVASLRAAGFPAQLAKHVSPAGPAAVLMVLVAALEVRAWSLARLSEGPAWHGALREALAVVARHDPQGNTPPAWLLGPRILGGLLRVAPWLLPFDLEAYLRVHFGKLRAQTQQALDEHIEHGQRGGLSTIHLQRLRAQLEPCPQPQEEPQHEPSPL